MGMGVEISVSTFLRAQLCGANNDNLLDVTLMINKVRTDGQVAPNGLLDVDEFCGRLCIVFSNKSCDVHIY